MKWKKIGQIYRQNISCKNLLTHASNPLALHKKESIYRLLSPLLNIFFGVPNSKKMRQEINDYMKQNDLNKLESLFLNFIQSQKI